MKKALLSFVVILITATTLVSAQDFDPKWGVDPADREGNIKTYNLLQDAYNSKLYDEALGYIKTLITAAPKGHAGIYIRGAAIYQNKFYKATTPAEQASFLDSVMMMYDLRNAAFADSEKQGEAYIKENKARTFYELAPNQINKAQGYFRDAIDAAGTSVNPEIVEVYFGLVTDSYKLDDISTEKYIEAYEYATASLSEGTELGDKETSQALERLFISSGAASCENIEKIFRPQYEADPNNAELARKILGLFQRSHCTSEFQFAMLESYYKLDPKPTYALMLASAYEDRKNYSKALEYIEIAIASETDPKQKINHYLRAASAQLSTSRYRQAADLAQKVIALDSNQGVAYLIYASSLAGGVSQSCSEFERQAAFWLVVDAYRNSLRFFAGDPAQIQSINSAIYSYSSNFPKGEELFMIGLEIGASYTVNCGWVSGRTTVRAR